jgi:hypothetical protein
MAFHESDQTHQVQLEPDDEQENQVTWMMDQVDWGVLLHQTLDNVCVAKWFDEELCRGTVVDVIRDDHDNDNGNDNHDHGILFRIEHQDGDEEDFDQSVSEQGKKLCEDHPPNKT